jgi:hypothetical protein
MEDTYTPDAFQQLTGKTLELCVSDYEAEASIA